MPAVEGSRSEDPVHGRMTKRAGPLVTVQHNGLLFNPVKKRLTEPVTVQRRASVTGVIRVCRQRLNLGRVHAGRAVTVAVSEATLSIDLGGREHAPVLALGAEKS